MKTTLILLISCLVAFGAIAQQETASLDPSEVRVAIEKKTDAIDADALFLAATRMAKVQLLDFINKEVTYPEAFTGQYLEGTVIVDFWINDEGKIIQTKIMEGINKSFDDAVLEKVNTLKNLNLQGGTYLGASRLRIPIDFSMY